MNSQNQANMKLQAREEQYYSSTSGILADYLGKLLSRAKRFSPPANHPLRLKEEEVVGHPLPGSVAGSYLSQGAVLSWSNYITLILMAVGMCAALSSLMAAYYNWLTERKKYFSSTKIKGRSPAIDLNIMLLCTLSTIFVFIRFITLPLSPENEFDFHLMKWINGYAAVTSTIAFVSFCLNFRRRIKVINRLNTNGMMAETSL